MPARLTAIIFDQATEEYVCGEMVAAGPDNEKASFDFLDEYKDLKPAFRLKDLPKGDYTLTVSADIEKEPLAKFTLINSETFDVVMTAEIDLQPLMESALLYQKEYTKAMEEFEDSSYCDNEVLKIHKQRAIPLQNILDPYIINKEKFGIDLLEFLDILTAYFIETHVAKMAKMEMAAEKSPDIFYAPQNRVIH